jgi:predicted TIM-barrel fold metal-dependent hydrolase
LAPAIYTPGRVVRDLIPTCRVEIDFVIDHMGYMLESDGLTRADFDRLLEAVAYSTGWMKLSGPYRVAKDGNYAKLRPLARAIVEAVGHRTIWGSDWPHIPNGQMDTGSLLNLLADWCLGQPCGPGSSATIRPGSTVSDDARG